MIKKKKKTLARNQKKKKKKKHPRKKTHARSNGKNTLQLQTHHLNEKAHPDITKKHPHVPAAYNPAALLSDTPDGDPRLTQSDNTLHMDQPSSH
jgi:hypothetical protein